MRLKGLFHEFSQAVGFDRLDEMIVSIFLAKQAGLSMLAVGVSVVATTIMFMENYIFYPSYTYCIALSGTAFESIMGTIDSIITKKEKFNLQKALRIVPKLVAHGAFLSFSWHMGQAESAFLFLPTALFIYLTSINFTKSLWHGSRLGWLPKGVSEIMQKRFEGLKK